MTFGFLRLARKLFYLSGPSPRHVDIEISTRCNLQCPMCRRQTVDYGDKLMDYDLYRQIIDGLPDNVELVSLGGYGEMLLHPRYFEMVNYAAAKGLYTQTTSNGTALGSEKQVQELLRCGLGRLHVSVDYIHPPSTPTPLGHPFSSDVIHNLAAFAGQLRSRRAKLSLGINCVVHAGNFDQIEELLAYAATNGLDFVELIPLDDNENHAERLLDPTREIALYRRVKSAKLGIRVITPLNRFPAWRRAFHMGRPFCHFRQQMLHINVDGGVTLCPYGFSHTHFGKIQISSLQEIWRSPRVAALRKNPFNETCKECRIFSCSVKGIAQQ